MEKLTIKDLKNKIKVLAAEQIVLKNQRKTVHLEGERTMEPWKARCQHQVNRSDLRDFYLAYGILRGRKPEEIDANYPYQLEHFVNKIIEQYNGEVIRSSSN